MSLKTDLESLKIVRSFKKGARDHINKCKEFLKQDPKNNAVLSMLSKHYFWLEDFDEAHHYLEKILQQNPNDFEALKLMVQIYDKRNDEHKVYEYLNLVITNIPKDFPGEGDFLGFISKALKIIPKFRKADMKIKEYVEEDKIEIEFWKKWAEEYFAYYEDKYKVKRNNTEQ